MWQVNGAGTELKKPIHAALNKQVSASLSGKDAVRVLEK